MVQPDAVEQQAGAHADRHSAAASPLACGLDLNPFDLAYDAARRRLNRLIDQVADVVQESCEALSTHDAALARRVQARQRDVQSEAVRIDAEVEALLARQPPSEPLRQQLCLMLKITRGLRDSGRTAAELAGTLRSAGSPPPAQCAAPLRVLSLAVQDFWHSLATIQAACGSLTVLPLSADHSDIERLFARVVAHAASDAVEKPAQHAAASLVRIATLQTHLAASAAFIAGCLSRLSSPHARADLFSPA